MTATATRRARGAATLAASIALAAASVLGGSVMTPAPAAADAPASSRQEARFETEFLKNMIDHHAMAVRMAQTCVNKATHDELRQMCQSIVDSQSAQIEQMQSWLQDWYGISHEPQLSAGDKQSMQRLESLSGAEYEIRFMRSMIRHHSRAVNEAERCLDRAAHAALLELCGTIKQSQSAEIATMQSWLEQWYDKQGGRPSNTLR